MARSGQNFEFFKGRVERQFGGMLLKGNAKQKRPLSSKHAVHMVLKSELAVGARSFLRPKNVKHIERIIRTQAQVFGVRLYHFVNVGNHLHLVLRLPPLAYSSSRTAFFSFVRAVTGLIARHVVQAERSRPKSVRFWTARPFTRLLSWGRDFTSVSRYMEKNRSEARTKAAFVDWGFDHIDPVKIVNLDTG
jgi:hypothetical protein